MNSKRLSLALTLVLSISLTLLLTSPCSAATGTVIHSFNGLDGTAPILGLTFDAAGNLYGVAYEGGAYNSGTIFELVPTSGGNWNETTLYTFKGGTDGAGPLGSLILDNAGSLYGTTKLGGMKGVGTAFKLVHSGSAWTKKILHNFGGGSDGQYPTGNLIFDTAGNLYGTTQGGGAYGTGSEYDGGTAYELSPQSHGSWKETILHSFGNGTDGATPRGAGLVFDNAGNLFGTTYLGGNSFSHANTTQGTVFELSPQAGGGWTESVIYAFNVLNGVDGYHPAAGLIFDKAGNLYGTTAGAAGTIFELLPQAGGGWTETVLTSFILCSCGSNPYSGLVFDSTGTLYTAAVLRSLPYGQNNSVGSVVQATPSGGFWSLVDIFDFDGSNGSNPGVGSLILDSSGNFYGGAQNGGAFNNGAVFKITP
jgi:hypothetical protein